MQWISHSHGSDEPKIGSDLSGITERKKLSDISPIAFFRSDFNEKFGIPRQSGLVPELIGQVIFRPEFASPEAVRGLSEFSHIWLIWQFSENVNADWKPTVRPPRLGGKVRMGVFATRSPFRPNSLGLSSVRLLDVATDGSTLTVGGADLLNNTPIFDVKPYVTQDLHPQGDFGFTTKNSDYRLDVEIPSKIAELVDATHLLALRHVLAEDPRPAHQHIDGKEFGLSFAGYNVRFSVTGHQLKVIAITR